MQLALEALDTVCKEFSVDSTRLYVTGLSMGGYATWDCVTRFPNRFAAGAPICGGGDEKTVTAAAAKVPVWAFHSDDDAVVKVIRTRNMIKAMRAAGGQPKYFEYFGLNHASWNKAYGEPEFLPWMFAQRLGQPDTYTLKTPSPELPAVARFPEDSAFPGKGPIRKADWFRNVWRERRLMAWNGRQRDQGAVVFLGDSITHGWGSLAKDFPSLKVANRGISGDLTRGVLYRLQEDVLDLKPAAVVLLIGTNDLEDQADPEVVAQNVKAILAALKAHNPKMPVIVCKVMPSDSSKSRPAEQIKKLNVLVDALVKGDSQFIRCDTWSIFADENGNAKKEEFPDLLHPNAAGYAKFAGALRPIFESLKLGK
jgi:lysophospholipase L1-like esterase